MGKRRNLIVGGALFLGSAYFLGGATIIALLFDLEGDPQERLFRINVAVGTAVVALTLGGFLVWQAASSLGGSMSRAMHHWLPWPLLAAFPSLVLLGQLQVTNPERLPWVFPFVNVGIVAIPSLVAAMTVAGRYAQTNPLSWPMSWREWTSGIIYGALGATSIAGVINTAYFAAAAIILVTTHGDDSLGVVDGLPTLPRGWGIFFDISVLSIVAPINEEFWKGAIVALYFFRKGGAARCFCWGVLAGTGFNLIETFQNSLSVVSPEVVADRTIGSQWWLFALARAGAGTMHAAATGFAALAFYGLLRNRPRLLLGYLFAIALHGSWNFLVYVIEGDAYFSQAGPDSIVLDVLGVAGLIAVFCAAAVLLWVVPSRLRDDSPAPIYLALGMQPASAPPNYLWPKNPFAVTPRVMRPKGSAGPYFKT